MTTNLKTNTKKIDDLDQEVDRLEDSIVTLEGDNLEIQQARNEFHDAMEEELEVWDEVAATQAAVELLDTESAEIQQREEERLRQKREAAKESDRLSWKHLNRAKLRSKKKLPRLLLTQTVPNVRSKRK